MSNTIVPSSSVGGIITRTKQALLDHGFEIVSKPGDPKRNSFTFNGRFDTSRTNLFDIQTAQRPGQPYLAIDLQPIPSGFGSAGCQNDVVESKLADLPPSLKASGKGILLIGNPKQYYLDEIHALSNFSWTLPEGCYVVIAKTLSNEVRNCQGWTSRITGAKCNYNYEGYAVPDVISFLRQDIQSQNKQDN